MHEGEDAGPAADPAGIPRQVAVEKLHHLAASRGNLAPLTLERGSRVFPCHPRGGRTEKQSAGAPSCAGPAYSGRGKLWAMTPLLGPTVGHPGDLQRGEGRRAGNKLPLVRVPVGAPFVPLAPPPRRRDGLISSVASRWKGPLLPSVSAGWGLYPRLGGYGGRGWGKNLAGPLTPVGFGCQWPR